MKCYDSKGRLGDPHSYDRNYLEVKINCICIENPVSISDKHFSSVYDDSFSVWSHDDGNCKPFGVYNMNTNPTITPGYVYVIKDKEENK